MTTIHFVRHGNVLDPDNIFYGRLPGFPLSEEGKQCVHYTGKQLATYKIEAIYYGPLLRTKQSAEILEDYLGCSIYEDERLTEMETLFEGKSRDYLAQYPPVSSDYSETMEQIYERMASFVKERTKQHTGQVLVAVGHGGPIRILEMGLLDQPFTEWGYMLDTVPVCGSDTIVLSTPEKVTVHRVDL